MDQPLTASAAAPVPPFPADLHLRHARAWRRLALLAWIALTWVGLGWANLTLHNRQLNNILYLQHRIHARSVPQACRIACFGYPTWCVTLESQDLNWHFSSLATPWDPSDPVTTTEWQWQNLALSILIAAAAVLLPYTLLRTAYRLRHGWRPTSLSLRAVLLAGLASTAAMLWIVQGSLLDDLIRLHPAATGIDAWTVPADWTPAGATAALAAAGFFLTVAAGYLAANAPTWQAQFRHWRSRRRELHDGLWAETATGAGPHATGAWDAIKR